MESVKVLCRGCQRSWPMPAALTVYQQQAIESCPCPHCGAYTLSYRIPAVSKKKRRQVVNSGE